MMPSEAWGRSGPTKAMASLPNSWEDQYLSPDPHQFWACEKLSSSPDKGGGGGRGSGYYPKESSNPFFKNLPCVSYTREGEGTNVGHWRDWEMSVWFWFPAVLSTTGVLNIYCHQHWGLKYCWERRNSPFQHPVTLKENLIGLLCQGLCGFLKVQIYQYNSLLSTAIEKPSLIHSPDEQTFHFLKNFVLLFDKLIFVFKAAGPVYLYTPKVAMLWGDVNGAVTILVHFIQRDALFLHKLKKPQKNLFLKHKGVGN